MFDDRCCVYRASACREEIGVAGASTAQSNVRIRTVVMKVDFVGSRDYLIIGER